MTEQHSPLQSLREGHWFKLICGASFQHLPAIRNLTLVYTLAGADCIDVAADPAVILAAQEAITVARQFTDLRLAWVSPAPRPWLMVSLNDGEDPHFRKAEFLPDRCPVDCARPCEAICPAEAIDATGVIGDRCYGCGRCLPICPLQHITARTYVSTPQAIAPLIGAAGIDAIEIHTQPGHFEGFRRLWAAISPHAQRLKVLAISCPDGEDLIPYLQTLADLIAPLPCPLIWQTDGRPMSGDIGIGTTKATVKLGQKVLQAGLPGYVQLAGGTNHHTVAKLRSLNLLRSPQRPSTNSSRPIAGVAYGSYARTLLRPFLEPTIAPTPQLGPQTAPTAIAPAQTAICDRPPTIPRLETAPEQLRAAITLAASLVGQLKAPYFAPPPVP